MSCDVREDSPGSTEENSVKNLASMFNQPNQGPGMGPPPIAARPGIGAKPSVSAKPGKLDLDNNIKIIGPTVRSPLFEKPSNGTAKAPSKVPPSKVPPSKVPPKPSPTKVQLPVGGPMMLGTNPADILNMKNQLKKAPVPRPPVTSSASEGSQVDFKRSLKKPPVAPPKRAGDDDERAAEAPANKAPTDEAPTEAKENVSTSKSDGDSSSLSSFTSDSSIARRGSSTSQKASGDKKPMLEPLPPLETIGPPPKKPAKPENYKLPRPARPPPAVKRKPSARKAQPAEVGEDSGEIYDDVDVDDNRAANKRISLIPTMDSDEEESVEDLLYDDTDVMPAPSLPPLPPVPSIPAVPQTSGSDDGPQEIYDDVSLEGESEELYEALDVSSEDTLAQKRVEKDLPCSPSRKEEDVRQKSATLPPGATKAQKAAKRRSTQVEKDLPCSPSKEEEDVRQKSATLPQGATKAQKAAKRRSTQVEKDLPCSPSREEEEDVRQKSATLPPGATKAQKAAMRKSTQVEKDLPCSPSRKEEDVRQKSATLPPGATKAQKAAKQRSTQPSVQSEDAEEASFKQAGVPPPPSSLSPKKTVRSRQEEKQKKEQEKLEQQRRKKEEEQRKKREKEEKKRKEKVEKEMKKKFNIKGDIRVLDIGTTIQDCGSDYEKTDLICKQGDRLEILRRDGNPQGKWLARDMEGRYGFVDSDFVAIENECQETYDDVIPCDDSSAEEEEPQEIYEAFD